MQTARTADRGQALPGCKPVLDQLSDIGVPVAARDIPGQGGNAFDGAFPVSLDELYPNCPGHSGPGPLTALLRKRPAAGRGRGLPGELTTARSIPAASTAFTHSRIEEEASTERD